MQPDITANKWIKYSVLVFSVVYLYIIIRTLHLRGFADDQYFLNIFNSHHIIEHVYGRYFTWTGRFPLELLMTTTIGFNIFWKVGVPASIILLCFSVCRITNYKSSILSFGAALVFFATIPTDINSDASWWVTGFYNYLLPVSLAVYAFSVSYTNRNNIIERAFCIIFSFYYSYMEQAGILYVIAMMTLILFIKERRNKFNYSILLISTINLIICLKAPGNEQRVVLETWTWYPQYQTYGIINKLSLGFDKLHQLMTFRYNIPLIGLSTSILFLGANSGKLKISVKISMVIIMTFISLSVTNSLTGFFSDSSFFYNSILHASRWSSAKIFISYLYIFLVISSMFTIMFDALIKFKISAMPIIAMLLGFMSVTMLGMSPTVYASGLRVDFIFEIMCITSCMYLSIKVYQAGINK